ncbi:MAG: hypothetical protein WDW36_009128 [Sanguina aurantia]
MYFSHQRICSPSSEGVRFRRPGLEALQRSPATSRVLASTRHQPEGGRLPLTQALGTAGNHWQFRSIGGLRSAKRGSLPQGSGDAA